MNERKSLSMFLIPKLLRMICLFFFSSFLAKEKKNQKEKTRFQGKEHFALCGVRRGALPHVPASL